MNNLMSNLSENYEYLRIIINNQLEIKKLDLIEDSATVVSIGLLFVIILILFSTVFLSISAIAILLLSSALGSSIHALIVFIGILLFLAFCIFFFRKNLIIKPTKNLFYSLIKNRI